MLQEWDGEKEMLMTVQARIPFQFFPWLKSPFRVFLSPVSSFTDHPHFQTSYFKFWTKLPMAKGKHHSSVFVSCSITLFTILPAFSLSSVFFLLSTTYSPPYFCFHISWICSPSPSVVLILTFGKPAVTHCSHPPIPYCWGTPQTHMISYFRSVGRKGLLWMLPPFIHNSTWLFWSQTGCLGWFFRARGSRFSWSHRSLPTMWFYDSLCSILTSPCISLSSSLWWEVKASWETPRQEAQLHSMTQHSEYRAMGSLQRDLPNHFAQE